VSSAARFLNWLQGFLAQPACSEVLSLCEVVARFRREALPYTIQPGILSCVLAPCLGPLWQSFDFAVFPLGGQNSRRFKVGRPLFIYLFLLKILFVFAKVWLLRLVHILSLLRLC